MITVRAICDECGEKHVSSPGFEREGWLEIWKVGGEDEDTPLDFCCQQCLVDYYQKED